jgi:hypothetical protein
LVLEVGSEVGASSPFLLFDLDGQIFFRSERQGSHTLIAQSFLAELEALGVRESPVLVEGGRVLRTDLGIRLCRSYCMSMEDAPEGRQVTEATRFLRERCPGDNIESNEEE